VKDNIVLVGNKADLITQRQVSLEEAEEMCRRLELLRYFDASASENMNVDEIFYTIAIKAFETDKMLYEQDI
jgi:GTPase SAR1 family protein